MTEHVACRCSDIPDMKHQSGGRGERLGNERKPAHRFLTQHGWSNFNAQNTRTLLFPRMGSTTEVGRALPTLHKREKIRKKIYAIKKFSRWRVSGTHKATHKKTKKTKQFNFVLCYFDAKKTMQRFVVLVTRMASYSWNIAELWLIVSLLCFFFPDFLLVLFCTFWVFGVGSISGKMKTCFSDKSAGVRETCRMSQQDNHTWCCIFLLVFPLDCSWNHVSCK